jgi:NAD(P)H-dependent flavin oxidoreductase YrpB (nitropropane dioxygenase family)
MLNTAMTYLVGCSVPIQQAPMGPVASPGLVRAVAEAGGLGTLTALGRSADELVDVLDGIRKATTGAIGANFITDNMDRECIEAAASRVRVIDFFWSDPDATLVELAHAGGALACWQVGSVSEARAAADAGCDLIVAQGTEAGGHVRGELPLLPLLGAVLDTVSVPVLASGGIGTARGVAAVLAAGAAGVRVGTRFVATAESGAHPVYQQALVSARAADTEITSAFSVGCPLCAQRPRHRILSSAVAAAQALKGDVVGDMALRGQRVALPRFAGLPPHRGVAGQVEAMALYAGTSVDGVSGVATASEVVHELADGAERLLRAW